MLAKARSLPSLTILQVSGCRTLRHTWHSHYSLSGSTKTRKPESFKCAFHFWGGNHPWRQTHLAKSWCLGYSLASGVYKYRNTHTNTNTNINTNINTITNTNTNMVENWLQCWWLVSLHWPLVFPGLPSSASSMGPIFLPFPTSSVLSALDKGIWHGPHVTLGASRKL